MLLKVKQTAISCLATSIEGRALVATLVNGIGARRILSQGSGKFRLNFHSLPIGRVSLHNELALESNVTDVESKEFAKHLEDRMRYWLVRKKDWRKAISILRACKLNAFNSDARGSPDQFVLQLLPYLPLLVGSCAKVSKWLQALQMTKEFLAKMCGIPDSSLLLAQADIAKTLASQHLVQPALSLLVPDDVSATVDPTDEAALLARRAFTSASRILLVASFQSANWMVSLQALQCLHALRCRPQSLDRAAAQCLASCSEWPVAIALAVEPQFQRCLGLQSYTSFARICGFQAWPIALHLAEDGETRKELQVAQSSMLQDVLLAARMKEQQWQDSFAFFRALEDQKAHRDKEMTRLETRGSSHAPRDVHAVTGATLVTSRGAEMEVSNSVWTKAGGTGRHPSRLSFDALIRSCCDGFQENDTGWQESFELLERLKVNFGSFRTYDAYTLCEVMRACVSGAQWQHSILFLDVLGPAHPDSRTLSYILTIRASSMPRHWLMVLALLARSKNQRVRPHVGMYDAAIFSCKGTWDHPWSQWTRALRILEEVRWKRLRCNPFMFQATLRACQSNHEWRPSMELLQTCLGNMIEAHENQYSATLGVCAKAIQWSWGLHLVHDDMQRLHLKICKTALKPCIDVFQESQSWQEANILLRRAQAQSLRVSFQRLHKMTAAWVNSAWESSCLDPTLQTFEVYFNASGYQVRKNDWQRVTVLKPYNAYLMFQLQPWKNALILRTVDGY